MIDKHLIIDTATFKETLDIFEERSNTILEAKKELGSILTSITINKEDLNAKLDSLDSYLNKVTVIQKQVIGDTSIDKQYQNLLNKIDENFNEKIKYFNSKIEEIEKAREEHLSLIAKERDDLLVVGKNLKGKTNADGLNTVLVQLSSAMKETNTILTAVKETNKELIAVKRGGIVPLIAGIILGGIIFTITHFVLKGTMF